MIIIDEIGMISAELLGTLAYVVEQAVRTHGTYKRQQDKTICKFGGYDVVMCGDF